MVEGASPWTLAAPGLSVAESAAFVSVLCIHAFDAAVGHALSRAFELTWPVAPNTVVGEAPRVAWLSPGEWAVFDSADAVGDRIYSACRGRLHHLVDVSAGRRRWRLEGPKSAELIAKGCSLDTHPRVFGPGCCAQTLLAQIPILLTPERGSQGYDILADATLAGHLRSWFVDAALEYRT